MKVNDLMTQHLDVINANDSLQQAAEEMQRLDIGDLPVIDGGKAVGMVTDRDIVIRGVALGLNPGTTAVASVMTEELYCVPQFAEVQQAADLMEKHQIRRLPVVDENGQLCGIVSLGDIATRGDDARLCAEVAERVCEPARV